MTRELDLSKKPDRRTLLRVVNELQNLIGEAQMHHRNDRDPDGFEKGNNKLDAAFELCIAARRHDPP